MQTHIEAYERGGGGTVGLGTVFWYPRLVQHLNMMHMQMDKNRA
jgi:hypothetical protein